MANNLTLGRGELWFARYKPGTQDPEGERYLGNSPEFSATIESETLDHFDSDHGVNEKDESVPLSTNRTGSFITDNIDPENVALFFFGTSSALTVVGSSVAGEQIEGIIPGLTYQLGSTPTNPSGARMLQASPTVAIAGSSTVAATGNLAFSGAGTAASTVTIGSIVYTLVAAPAAAFEVKIGASATETAANLAAAINAGAGAGSEYGTGTTAHTGVSAAAATGTVTLTAKSAGISGNSIGIASNDAAVTPSGATLSGGTGVAPQSGIDFTIDLELGRLTTIAGGSLQVGDTLEVSYSTETSTRDRIISGASAISGSLRFIAFNPVGKNFDWFMPYVKLTPNGDYALKGDEWQQIPFNVEILKKGSLDALYIDGRPYTP